MMHFATFEIEEEPIWEYKYWRLNDNLIGNLFGQKSYCIFILLCIK